MTLGSLICGPLSREGVILYFHSCLTPGFVSEQIIFLPAVPLELSCRDPVGTLVQCRSQKFQKCVIYLSEICQKTVIYKNLSENHLNCVRYMSEICQIQISVIIMSEKFWKCLKYVSVAKNVSENCHGMIQKTVRNQFYDTFLQAS